MTDRMAEALGLYGARARPSPSSRNSAPVSTRARLAVAVAIALAVGRRHRDPGGALAERATRVAAAPSGLHETRAAAPFAGSREVRVAVGGRCVRVVVADTDAAREQGLRGVDRLGPYGGMLFVQPGDTDTAFTMAGVTTPLDITWYAARRLPDRRRARMAPCPNVTPTHCPVYRSRTAVPARARDARRVAADTGASRLPCA